MDTYELFDKYSSLITSGTGNNNYISMKSGETAEFLSWYRPRRTGKLGVVIAYYNVIYSTGCSEREKRGGRFTVLEAAIGFGAKVARRADAEVPVLFNGGREFSVARGFKSDETEIEIPSGAWLCVRLKIRADEELQLPTTDESASSGYRNGLRTLNVLRPNFIGFRADFTETLVLFGDSITQGTRTGVDKYEAWSHRVLAAAPRSVSAFNLGMGWSRAYDAAADGIFMRLAKNATKITICFGVNDIKTGGRSGENIIESLKTIVRLLREHNPSVDIILFTIPPFNLEPDMERERQRANGAIFGGEICEKVFDIAEVLELGGGQVRPEYMSSPDDAHPNGLAGKAVAEKFLREFSL